MTIIHIQAKSFISASDLFVLHATENNIAASYIRV